MIFDKKKYDDDSPKRNQESSFSFLSRCSWQSMARVRDFLESACLEYPLGHVEELVARFRSGDDVHFRSATFELVLHAALTRRGFQLDPHPALSNGSNARPDFLVTDTEGKQFYLEAVLAAMSFGDFDRSADARKGVVIDVLNANAHPNFMLDLDDTGKPATPPNAGKLVRELLTWLDSLDPDAVSEICSEQSLYAAPTYEWAHDGWFVTFRPIPLKPSARGKSSSLVGISGSGGGWLDCWSPIRDAVKSKGTKYGVVDKPLLLAVNMNSFHLDRIDEMQALFGQEQFTFSSSDPSAEPKFSRVRNGAWLGANGPQYKRVSGTWIFNSLLPHTVAVCRQTIYLNPWATLELPNSLASFPHACAEGSTMKWNDGISLSTLFDLPAGWPELNAGG